MLVFLAVGGGTAVFYAGLIALFHHGMGWAYTASITLAYPIAVSAHFVLSRMFTFAASKAPVGRHLPRYLVYIAGNYLLTLAIVSALVEWARWPVMLASAVAIVLCTGLGFVVSKYWVFAVPSNQTGAERNA